MLTRSTRSGATSYARDRLTGLSLHLTRSQPLTHGCSPHHARLQPHHARLQALRAGPRQRGPAAGARHGGGSRAAAAAGWNTPSSARHPSPPLPPRG